MTAMFLNEMRYEIGERRVKLKLTVWLNYAKILMIDKTQYKIYAIIIYLAYMSAI